MQTDGNDARKYLNVTKTKGLPNHRGDQDTETDHKPELLLLTDSAEAGTGRKVFSLSKLQRVLQALAGKHLCKHLHPK